MKNRTAVTAVEVLVLLAIMAALIAILVPAVQRVREAAVCTQSKNNLKQIILAVHNYADANNGRLPLIGDILSAQITAPDGSTIALPMTPWPSLFISILPYVDQGAVPQAGPYPIISLFFSPADPSAGPLLANGQAICSYAVNAQVFQTDPRLPGSITDGTSNTIAFAEHYAQCGTTTFYYWQGSTPLRPSFADLGGVVPGPIVGPSIYGDQDFPTMTYQTAPPVSECYPGVPQTPHPGGMLIALADGSVRQIAPNIPLTVYWALVTPAAGDDPGGDW